MKETSSGSATTRYMGNSGTVVLPASNDILKKWGAYWKSEEEQEDTHRKSLKDKFVMIAVIVIE